ncbi:translocase of chloroplast 159, chloroplastic [Humulus lupulus]|uniref:translocase of chloroplast 159, chloroplastic n=1 Tax=Humulus lupulus TaxID=3486 RepID=UPI002B40F76E|nr:translocase of chloroplast 159, chloroplastic [Humulus lupulus]
MEPKPSTPDATTMTPPPPPSSSFSTATGSSYSYSPYQYSDVDDSPVTFVSTFDNGDKGVSSGVGTMLSGENERPIAKVSLDDDDNDDDDDADDDDGVVYGLGGSRLGVLEVQELGKDSAVVGAESSLEGLGTGGGRSSEKVEDLAETESIENSYQGGLVTENGVSSDDKEGDKVLGGLKYDDGVGEERLVVQKSQDFDGGESEFRASEEVEVEVEDGKIVDGGNDKDNSVNFEEKNEKLVEEDGVSLGGDESVVEAVQLNVPASREADVGVSKELDEAEIRGVEPPGGGNLGPGSEEFVGTKLMPTDSESDGNVVGSVTGGPDEVDTKHVSAGEDGGLKANSEVHQSGPVVEKGADNEKVLSGDGVGPKLMPTESESNGNVLVEPVIGGSDEVDTKHVSGREEGGLEADSDVQRSSLVAEKGANDEETLSGDGVGPKLMPTDSESNANVLVEPVIGGVEEVDTKNISGREEGGLEADSDVQQNSLVIEKGAGNEVLSGDGVETFVVNRVSDLTKDEQVQDENLSNNAGSSIEEPSSVISREIMVEDEDDEKQLPEEYDEIDGSGTDGETEDIVFGSSAKQFLEELERASGVGSHSGADSSHDHSQRIDGQIVTDSDEEADSDDEGGGKEMFDSAALAALLKAATGATPDGGNITITSSDGSRLFSVERPAGLGSSLPSVKPASRPLSNIFSPSNLTVGGESENNLSEEDKKRLEKFQQLRVKYLRLVKRVGGSIEDSIARQVLYRLALVSGRQAGQAFSLESAKAMALQLESEGKDDLDFSLNILVIGKTGVGKSATINSIFGEEKTPIYAFGPSTTSVKEIVGTVDGVKIRVFDTPGLKSAAMEQSANRKILSSVKNATKKCPPDIVLYVDRLDTQSRDLNDLPMLRSITSALGPSIWRSAIVTLTHAASSPPDGPSGTPLNYELFVAQRSQIVQQTIGQAVGDLRVMSPSLMNPISLAENHPSCRKNRDGQKVLPNGQAWRSQLLLLSYSMKILSEASNLSKPQESVDHRKLFGFRSRSPPLPYLLSWLLQSRAHPKLSADQGGENGDSDIDLDDLSDSDNEEEDEYDQLPPFKPLRNFQIAKLSKEQKKAYMEEYDYRVKLLQKKQWREELKRMKEMKKRGGKVSADELAFAGEDDPENGTPAAVPVALPDMALPPSFDGDNPAYRYRFLEPTSQFLARPVLDTHGWDHDCGYDGVNLEHNLAIVSRFPGAVAVQITKDKKEFNIHLDSSVSAKHGDNGSSMAGFDIQNIGKQLAYIVRGETKFKSFRKNKTTAGASVTFLGENVSTGFKIEDQIGLGKRVVLVGSTGIVKSQSDSAYGANLEVRLREADFPIGQDQSSLGLSLVKWRGDLALGANLQSQFSLGRNYKVAVRAGLNNKLSGQISVRTSSSEQLQLALVAILPVVRSIYKIIWPGAAAENYALY